MNTSDSGLQRDKHDEKASRHVKEAHVGHTYQHEWYQPMPHFFTREGSALPLMGNYRGAKAFLICNGPSFNSIDKDKLSDCFTMGINNGVASYRPNLWCCVDDPARFIKSTWLDPKITKFVPYDHSEKELWNNEEYCELGMRVGDCPNVLYFKRNEKFHASRWLFESTLNWGDHKRYGGGRSVLLPALRILFLLGFRTVYLLGCDLHMHKDEPGKDLEGKDTFKNNYHFNEGRSKGAVNGNNSTYKKMIGTYFPALKPEFEKHGFNVYNCNPDSALKVFDYVPFDDAVANALNMYPEIRNPKTEGSYKTFKEHKTEFARRHQEQQAKDSS
jgi:hypothetical protein